MSRSALLISQIRISSPPGLAACDEYFVLRPAILSDAAPRKLQRNFANITASWNAMEQRPRSGASRYHPPAACCRLLFGHGLWSILPRLPSTLPSPGMASRA
jgi:hypothetical protein